MPAYYYSSPKNKTIARLVLPAADTYPVPGNGSRKRRSFPPWERFATQSIPGGVSPLPPWACKAWWSSDGRDQSTGNYAASRDGIRLRGKDRKTFVKGHPRKSSGRAPKPKQDATCYTGNKSSVCFHQILTNPRHTCVFLSLRMELDEGLHSLGNFDPPMYGVWAVLWLEIYYSRYYHNTDWNFHQGISQVENLRVEGCGILLA